MICFQKEEFIESLDFILPEIHKIPLYDLDSYHKKFHPTESEKVSRWPGYRSESLENSNKFLFIYIISLLKKLEVLKNKKWSPEMYIHLRKDADEAADYIHQDRECQFAGLVYLNPTNLKSGTRLYTPDKEIINDFKYIQNRLIMYDSLYHHMAYGHFGSDVLNGRLTLNIFINYI